MKIYIGRNISERTYNFSVQSVSYVIDETDRVEYILKGNYAKLWEIIAKTQDYDLAENYAQKLGLADDFIFFISELKKYKLISVNIDLPENKKTYFVSKIKINDPNYEYFNNIKYNIKHKEYNIDNLSIQLSYKCNLNCVHCFQNKDENNIEVSADDAVNIIEQAYNIGVDSVILSGGECTICKDFLEIAKFIRSKHLKLTIITNGKKLSEDNELFNQIIKLYPHEIQVSLYSMNPDVHDAITGQKGSQNKTLKAINKLRNQGINVSIAIMQLKDNIKDVTEVRKFAKKINAGIKSSHLFINNINKNNKYVKSDCKNFYQIYIQENSIKYRNPEEIVLNSYICEEAIHNINITPNLDVTPCIDINYKLGNFKETSLYDIYNDILPEFRKTFINKNRKECFKHKYCKVCIFCPVNSIYECNGFFGKSEMLCEEAKAYYEFYKKHKNGIQR